MGDPDGARAMLDEVIEEGSQAQQDEAKRLLPDATD
jgi:pilus assembly protein FimV